MIKYFYNRFKLLSLLGILGLTFSCSDIEDDTFFTEGGSVLFYQNINPGFFDLGDTDNTSVGFDLNSGGDAVSNADITLSYAGSAGTMGPIALTSAAVPSSYGITLAEAATALGIAVSDVAVGDQFTFTATSGAASRSITVLGSCNSEIAGSYLSVTVGTSTDVCCPDETTVNDTIQLVDNGGGNYTMSDFSGGLYLEWYDIYGITPGSSPGDIRDVCNNLSMITETEPFGEVLDGSGSVDPATGVITFSWVTGYGDQGVSTLTPL